MQSAGIVTCENRKCRRGVHTRQYRVNIPLVLWLAGYKTGNWSGEWSDKARTALEQPVMAHVGLSMGG